MLSIVYSKILSSCLVHISGTFKKIGETNETCTLRCPMCDVFDEIQPSEGRTEPTDDRDRPSQRSYMVTQRSESRQGILGPKTGRGMLLR
jgi:hypothetical protein